MAIDKKISELASGAPAQAADEYVVARGAANYKLTLTNIAASMPPIGATTPNTASFTTLTTSSTVTLNGGTANGVLYLNGSKVATSGSALVFDGSKLSIPQTLAIKGAQNGNIAKIAMTRTDLSWSVNNETALRFYAGTGDTESPASISHSMDADGVFIWRNVTGASELMRLNTTGLGLGVTPSAWSTLKAIDISTGGAVFGFSSQAGIANNTYYDGANFKYKNTATAAYFRANGNAFEWFNAPSGTAGNTVTFTQAMTLNASGNLGVGTSSPTSGFRLDVQAADAKQRIESTTGTNSVQQRLINTGGTLFLGLDGSGGSTFGTVYAAALWHSGNYPLVFGTNNLERARISAAGDFGIGTISPGTYGKLDVFQATDPGTTPAAISVRTAGVAAGTAVPQYGINVDASSSYNNASAMYGIRVVASQNLGNTTYGVHSTVNAGNSNANRWAIYGKANVNSDAVHGLSGLPVGVYGEATNSTGTTNTSTSAAGYFLNSSTLGAVSYGVYIKTTAGPTTVIPLRVDQGSSELMRITSAGTLLVGTTSTTVNGGVIQVSNGITFPATQSACSDANTLDDYEEGTWTPVLNGATTTTYTTQIGRYTKIGRMVNCIFNIHINSVGNGSVNTMAGFPFTSNSGTVASGSVSYFQTVTTSTAWLSFYVENSATTAQFTGQAAIDGSNDNSFNTFQNGTNVIGSVTYFV